MAHKAALAACLLLAAVAVQAAERPMFADVLASATSPAASLGAASGASSPAAYYEEVDTHVACLRETAMKNCRGVNKAPSGFGAWFYESSVSCCKDPGYDHHREGLLGPDDIEIGSCDFDVVEFDDNVAVTSTAEKTGKFKATCTLKSAAHVCGYPFCDQMVLTAEGSIFYTEDVVSPVDPASVLPLDGCAGWWTEDKKQAGGKDAAHGGSKRQRRRVASRTHTARKADAGGDGKASVAVAADKGEAKPARYGDSYGSDDSAPRRYWLGAAYIFSGPMTVMSRRYDIKVQTGWFEYVYDMDWDTIKVVSEAEAQDKYLITPYTYTLKFVKPHVSSYDKN